MFYDKLLELCVERNISPSRAAEDVGMTGAHVTRWKRGSVPNDTTVQKFANYFNVPVGLFYDEITEQKPAVSDELVKELEILRERSDLRGLLHVAAKMTPEQVNGFRGFLESLKGGAHGETD